MESSVTFEEAVSYALQRLSCPNFQLKSEQITSIKHTFTGRDVFLWLPTGFGKSLCYQILPYLFDAKLGRQTDSRSSVVLVISPLVSLMVDQVRSLRQRGARAAILTTSAESSRVPDKSLIATDSDLADASYLFSAPEAILGSRWREALQSCAVRERIIAVAIDEAHCVSKWSKEFRPTYSRLHEIRALIPREVPFLACSATVTPSIRQECIEKLDMCGCELVSFSPDRPNIFYKVIRQSDIESDLGPLLSTLQVQLINTPRVIVYTRSLNSCADLFATFQQVMGSKQYYPDGAAEISDNRLFGMFHANTTQHNKEVILNSLSHPDGVVRVVFATVALGMGVDVKEITSIIHYGAPRSIDDYFQESGRGGRSGEQCVSTIYWKPSEAPMYKDVTDRSKAEVIAVRRYLENCTVCRRKWLLNYFQQQLQTQMDASLCCDVCRDQAATK